MNSLKHSLHFFNKDIKGFQPDIWRELKRGMWKELNLKNHLANSRIPANQPHKALDVFPGFVAVQPGTIYDITLGLLREDLYYPDHVEMDKSTLYSLLESYFRQYDQHVIAVHLSGGLDSSIIIGLLHHFGIPFYLVGLVSHRFEFRTEKFVQEKLAPLAVDAHLIDMEDFPSFTNLANAPLTQLPNSTFRALEATKAITKQCHMFGADIIFTGQGGDTIFVDAIPQIEEKWGCNIGSDFLLSIEANIIYPQYGLNLISPFADKNFIRSIYNLRIGHNNDHLKKWARGFFADVLPRELGEYTYAADFFGTSMSGLERAKPEIEQLFKTAHEVSGHALFAPTSAKKFLAKDVFNFEYQDYIEYCDVLALAIWYNSLAREGYVQ